MYVYVFSQHFPPDVCILPIREGFQTCKCKYVNTGVFFCGQLLQKLPSQVYFPPSQVYAPVGNAAPNFSFDGLTKNNNSFTLMYSSLSTFYSCLSLATSGALVFTLAFYRPAAATFSDFSAFHCSSLYFPALLCISPHFFAFICVMGENIFSLKQKVNFNWVTNYQRPFELINSLNQKLNKW